VKTAKEPSAKNLSKRITTARKANGTPAAVISCGKTLNTLVKGNFYADDEIYEVDLKTKTVKVVKIDKK
jgi:hypothetical protein